MTYEEKYKQALKVAKKELQACGDLDCDAARQIFRLFPELKEDEEIKEALVSRILENYDGCSCLKGISEDKVIDWLKSLKDR